MVEHTCFTGIYNDIAEILLKLLLNTNQSINQFTGILHYIFRQQILSNSNHKDLQYLIAMVDMLATCAEVCLSGKINTAC